MAKLNKKRFSVLVVFFAALFLIWFSGFSFDAMSGSGAVYRDNMRTFSSSNFAIDSKNSNVSDPLFSFSERRIYKFISSSILNSSLTLDEGADYREAEVFVRFKPLSDFDLDIEVKKDTDSYLPKRAYSKDVHVDELGSFEKKELEDYYLFTQEITEINEQEELVKEVQSRAGEGVSVFVDDVDLVGKLEKREVEKGDTQLNFGLIGTHTFSTYFPGGDLRFTVKYIDKNLESGPDRVNIRLEKSGSVIAASQQQDDGNSSNDGKFSSEKSAQLSVDGLSAGIYQLILDNSDDINAVKLDINSPNLLIEKSVYFDEDYNNKQLFTQSGILDLSAYNGRFELAEGQFAAFTNNSFEDISSIVFNERKERHKADYRVVQKDFGSAPDRNGWVEARIVFSEDEFFVVEDILPIRLVAHGETPRYLLDEIRVELRQ